MKSHLRLLLSFYLPEKLGTGRYDPVSKRRSSCIAGLFDDITGTRNLGSDSVGEVVAVGEGVNSLKEGDYVSCAFCQSFSEFTTPKEERCFRVPGPLPEYAALRVPGTFACQALESVVKIENGSTILITAACGGLGHIAVQIAKMNGCHVVGTCGTAQKKQTIVELGVDRAIDYSHESIDDVLSSEYPSGVHYVLDGVGGVIGRTAFENLAPSGKMLCAGYISAYPHTSQYDAAWKESLVEGVPPIPELLLQRKNAKVGDKEIITRLWSSIPGEIWRCRKRVYDLFQEKKLNVLVDPYALEHLSGIENVVNATEYMLQGRNVGKMVISL